MGWKPRAETIAEYRSKKEEQVTEDDKLAEYTQVKTGSVSIAWEIVLDHYEGDDPWYDVYMSNGDEPDEFFESVYEALEWIERKYS